MTGLDEARASGSFTLNNSDNWNKGHDWGWGGANISLSATKSSGIYGSSSTVTPLSLKVRYFIKF